MISSYENKLQKGAGMLVRKIKKAMVEVTSLPGYSINAPD